jgi:hypothetical protein
LIAQGTLVVLVLALLAGSTAGAVPAGTGGNGVADGVWTPGSHGVEAAAQTSWGSASVEGFVLDTSPAETPPAEPTTRTGTASTYGPGWKGWIAWPDGPGWRLRVCGPGGCVVVVTTDSGPDRAMQRAGRIVDLDVATFERVAGASWTVGLTKVKVTILGKVAVSRVVDPES